MAESFEIRFCGGVQPDAGDPLQLPVRDLHRRQFPVPGDDLRPRVPPRRASPQGLTNNQVANQIYLSQHTVAYHLKSIFGKLNVSSRGELTSLWARLAASELLARKTANHGVSRSLGRTAYSKPVAEKA